MNRILRTVLIFITPWLFVTGAVAEELNLSQETDRALYFRLIYGYSTAEKFEYIVTGDWWVDDDPTAIAGIQIATPLQKEEDDSSWTLTANAAVVRRLQKHYQDDFNEYTVALKTFYDDFFWKQYLRTRFGFAMGLSYAEEIPAMERIDLLGKGSPTSNLLLHMDMSFDFNLGDIFGSKKLESCYFGPSVWHRSGLYGKISFFNNVDGGYNWISLHMECLHRF